MDTRLRRTTHTALRGQQRGTMLIIALIVLVAMTLAGIAMMRSVDTSTIAAGNIAFKQSGVHSADSGVQAGFAWLNANIGAAALNNDNNAAANSAGYFSSAPATDPDWTNPSVWTTAALVNGGAKDDAGNVVSYYIHRLCSVPNCAPNATCGGTVNICGSTPSNTAISGEGVDQSAPNFFTLPPAIHYRVTARVTGPRNSVTVVQTTMRQQ